MMHNAGSRIKVVRRALWLVPALALLLAQGAAGQITLEDKPRHYLVIQMEGANRTWHVRPLRITSRVDANLRFASEGELAQRVERWERTGLPRRYDTSLWRRAFDMWLNADAPEGSRFYFYAIEPRQPRVDQPGVIHTVDERRRLYWVPPQRVRVVAYPMTWVDVYEAYVGQFSGEERQRAVIEWEARHRLSIANPDNTEEGFTPEERNEFARFYEQQFVYIRDRNPKLAGIYDELAAFHRERFNLDAELSTYLSALRAGVESPDRERFALLAGRAFVHRLQLYEPAIPYLTAALIYSEARWLLARCLIELQRHEQAREVIDELVQMLGSDELKLETDPDTERARAMLTLAELEFSLHNFAGANAAIDRMPRGTPYGEEARILFCAMLLNRNQPRRGNEPGDLERVRDIIREISFWPELQAFLNPGTDTVYPLSPLKARALVFLAQTEPPFRQPRPERPTQPRPELLAMLNAAKKLDPLSAEPYYAEFRLYSRLGLHREARAACEAGLDVEPRHVLLNYGLADLHFKTGLYLVAKDYLERCLSHDPNFYPALAMLGEISLAEIERARNALQIRLAAGEAVDMAGELVPPMKEAAAFFTAALAIYDNQPATRLALATLYLHLADGAPDTLAVQADAAEIRRAYLGKARELARELLAQLRRYADGERPPGPAEREIAEVPSLAAHNVYAYASYALGYHEEARQALIEHINRAADRRFFATPGIQSEYQRSEELSYARLWLRRIEENQRQYLDVDDFSVDSDAARAFFGNWSIVDRPKPDSGFRPEIRSGTLTLRIQQAETGIVSRFQIERPHSTLAAFEATFARAGDENLERGVYLSKARQAAGGGRPTPLATIMIGLDADRRVYWETRNFQVDNESEPEVRVSSGFIDVAEYGGAPLPEGQPVRLGIRRQLADGGGEVLYFALINGHEVSLPLRNDEPMARNDLAGAEMRLFCGFHATAFRGVQASLQATQARFVFDSGLAERRRN